MNEKLMVEADRNWKTILHVEDYHEQSIQIGFELIEHSSLFHEQLIRARVWLFCICQFGSVWTLNVEGCFFKIVSILVVLTVAFKSSSRLEKFSISTKLPQKIFENNINVRFDQISKHSKKI